MFKQHLELQKVNELLGQAELDKANLQEEVKGRNAEMYAMSEKMILSEYQGATLEDPIAKMANLQDRYDKVVDSNVRRVSDLQKLRSSINRLKSDL